MTYALFLQPHKNNIENDLDIIGRSLDTHACVDDETLHTFCKSYYSFNSLIKQSHTLKIPRALPTLI